MSKPDDIPDDVMEIAKVGLDKAWDDHAAVFGELSNSISGGLWDRLCEASALAIMAERNRSARVCRVEAEKAKAKGLTHEALGALWCAAAIRKGDA